MFNSVSQTEIGHQGEHTHALEQDLVMIEAVERHVSLISDNQPQCLEHETAHFIIPICLLNGSAEDQSLAYQESWAAECYAIGMEIGCIDQLGKVPVEDAFEHFSDTVKRMASRVGVSSGQELDAEATEQLGKICDDHIAKMWAYFKPALKFFESEMLLREERGAPSGFEDISCELMVRDLYEAVIGAPYKPQTASKPLVEMHQG